MPQHAGYGFGVGEFRKGVCLDEWVRWVELGWAAVCGLVWCGVGVVLVFCWCGWRFGGVR